MAKPSAGADAPVSYAKGVKPPRALRRGMKSSTFLSPVQCDEFKALIEAHGGFPQGLPDARKAFAERYEDNGRAWVRKEDS